MTHLEVAQEGVFLTHSTSENNCLAGEASGGACLGGRGRRGCLCRAPQPLLKPSSTFLPQLGPRRQLDILLSGHCWLCSSCHLACLL